MMVAIATVGCSKPESGQPGSQSDTSTNRADLQRQMLAFVGERVILKTYQDFAAAADKLKTAAGVYGDVASVDNLKAAQSAWAEAMDVWQRAEVFQLGPAGVMGDVVGGMDLRDKIYSWPLVNRCRVDQETLEQAYKDPTAFASEPINVRGLDAMEYLLFKSEPTNACKANSSINKNGTWAALSEDQISQQRAAYAATLAEIVAADAHALVLSWSGSGNFLAQFATAGGGSTTFATTQEALNGLSDAMFYLDTATKDMKLAIPAGLSGCKNDTCPEDVESNYAGRSKAHVLNNLLAFQLLYLGDGGPGFDDLLASVGAQELNDAMTQELAAAVVAVNAIDGTLAEAVSSNPQSVVTAHAAIKTIMDNFKTQFLGVLDLEIPQRAASDND